MFELFPPLLFPFNLSLSLFVSLSPPLSFYLSLSRSLYLSLSLEKVSLNRTNYVPQSSHSLLTSCKTPFSQEADSELEYVPAPGCRSRAPVALRSAYRQWTLAPGRESGGAREAVGTDSKNHLGGADQESPTRFPSIAKRNLLCISRRPTLR